MTSSSILKNLLERASDAFETIPETESVETGFEGDDVPAASLQMRKACRALTLARQLIKEDRGTGLPHQRYFAGTIELSFNAIERACQAILYASERLHEDEAVQDHEEVLRTSYLAGLWDEDDAETLAGLFHENRSKYYYRDGRPSRDRARTMIELAQEIHDLVVNSNLIDKTDCLCK